MKSGILKKAVKGIRSLVGLVLWPLTATMSLVLGLAKLIVKTSKKSINGLKKYVTLKKKQTSKALKKAGKQVTAQRVVLAAVAALAISFPTETKDLAAKGSEVVTSIGSSILNGLSSLAEILPTPSLGSKSEPKDFTVMVTNLTGNSGGSGSVIKTSRSESVVLTNKHVCEGTLKKGGMIRTVSGKTHFVTGYALSTEHDLCVLTVGADLKHSVSIAPRPPEMYEKTVITGHPNLLPNMITTGVFSDRVIITLMTGARKCTQKDMQDPVKGPLCMFFGIVPVIQSFEAQVSTATIMPGSSGSAVLNEDGELVGVAFAGSGRSLSYAFIVPYESVLRFIESDAKQIDQMAWKLRPWNDEESEDGTEEEHILGQDAKNILQQKCIDNLLDPSLDDKIKNICRNLDKYVTP